MNPDSIDPELRRQLEKAEAGEEEVQAVFVLRPSQNAQKFLSPDETERLTRGILERVEKECGGRARDCNIFRNIGSFLIQATPGLLRKLIAQDEIVSATANRQTGGMFILPRKNEPS